MSYLVLARKYRPQSFADIVGQEHVTRTLQNAIAQGRVHHAFLFTGARGVGKTTAARILAKALSCAQAPTPTPCNACDACREIAQGTSVDVQEIDAASNNGVDNIRELRESIRYAPVRGKKKVYILDEVHMLSGGAWNALLKTLEEPPPHAVFVFATTDPHKLPATILSRVQRYDFKLVPARRIVEHLTSILEAEQVPYERAALALVARESGGSVRDSLSLLDQVIAAASPGARADVGPAGLTEAFAAATLGVADRGLVTNLGRAVLARDADAALKLVDAAFARGYDLSQLAQALLGHLRDLVVVSAVQEPDPLLEGALADLDELRGQAQLAAPGLLELLFERAARLAEDVARSPLPRYVLEVGLVELTRVEPLEPLSGLLDRLESLEGRLERGGARTGAAPASPPRAEPTAPRATAGRPPLAAAPTEPAPAPEAAAPAPSVGPAKDRGEPKAEADDDASLAAGDEGPAPTARGAAQGPMSSGFTTLVEKLIGRDPLLSGLAQARLVRWDDQVLALGFDREFTADSVRDRMAELKQGVLQLTGQPLAIELIVGAAPAAAPATETLIEVEQRKLDEDRERRRREALEHPVRKMLDEKFGGTWKDPVVDTEGDR